MMESGNSYGLLRCHAKLSPRGAVQELLHGISYYEALKTWCQEIEEDPQGFLFKLRALYAKLWNKKELVVAITASSEDFEPMAKNLVELLKDLSVHDETMPREILPLPRAEAFQGPSLVQYVTKACRLPKGKYHGSMEVLAKLVSMNYLHGEIRAKGGAYGAGMSLNRHRDLSLYSYRDPNLKETLAVYENIPSFVETLDMDEDELEALMIGSISAFDPPLTPSGKGELALARYLSGLSRKEVEENIKECLRTDLSTLKELMKQYRDALADAPLTVVGHAEKIQQNADCFDVIHKLI